MLHQLKLVLDFRRERVFWGCGRDEWVPLYYRLNEGEHKIIAVETVKLKPGTGQNVKAVVVGMNNAVALIGNLIPGSHLKVRPGVVEIDEHGRTSMWISNDSQQKTMTVISSLVLAVVSIVDVVQSGAKEENRKKVHINEKLTEEQRKECEAVIHEFTGSALVDELEIGGAAKVPKYHIETRIGVNPVRVGTRRFSPKGN